MTPQESTVLAHLRSTGSISGVEAAAVHRIRHLPRRIADLRARGFQIRTERRRDATKQAYARYHLLDQQPVVVAPTQPPAQQDTVVLTAHTRFVSEDDTFEQIDLTFDAKTQTLHVSQDEDIIGLTKVQLRDFIACLSSLERLFT